MKASIIPTSLALACLLGFGVRAEAQDAPEHSMTGCLAKGDDAGTFKLTNLEKGPKEVVIAGSKAQLGMTRLCQFPRVFPQLARIYSRPPALLSKCIGEPIRTRPPMSGTSTFRDNFPVTILFR